MRRTRRELPEQATRCLTCACENWENRAANDLLGAADALTATGVVAALFVADSQQHRELVDRARDAIAEQRAWCDEHGAFEPNCPLLARTAGVPSGRDAVDTDHV